MHIKVGLVKTLIKMALYNIPNMTGGLDNTIQEIAREVPAFPIGILLFVFGVVFLGGITTQKRRSGFYDSPMWSVIASTSTLLVALLFTLVSGIIDLLTLGVVAAVTIFSGVWLYLSKGRGEI